MSNKKRFCKYCGNEIDSMTKKCTGCGKQYLNPKRLFDWLTRILLFPTLIAVIVLAVICSNQIKTIYDLQETLAEEQERSDEAESVYRYLKGNFVFTTPHGSAYHRLDCPYIKDRDIQPWSSISQAYREGYTPCTHCFREVY